MAKALPCPSCGRLPVMHVGYGYTLTCDECYDADYDYDLERYVSTTPCGSGMTRTEAIEDWNWKVADD